MTPLEINALEVFKRHRITRTDQNTKQRLIDRVMLQIPDMSEFELELLDMMLSRGVSARSDGEPVEIQQFRDKLGMDLRFSIQMYARNR